MTAGFKLRTSGVRSNRSTNCPNFYSLCVHHFLSLLPAQRLDRFLFLKLLSLSFCLASFLFFSSPYLLLLSVQLISFNFLCSLSLSFNLASLFGYSILCCISLSFYLLVTHSSCFQLFSLSILQSCLFIWLFINYLVVLLSLFIYLFHNLSVYKLSFVSFHLASSFFSFLVDLFIFLSFVPCLFPKWSTKFLSSLSF